MDIENTATRRTDVIGGKAPSAGAQRRGFFIERGGTKLFLLENLVVRPSANVVMISPFGKTTHDLFLISHYLTANGFNVFRFDPRDHHGLSSGVMEDFTLDGLERDTLQAVDAFHLNKDVPTLLLGMSLSFPVALKVAAASGRFAAVISVVGVVDVDDTLRRVTDLRADDYRSAVPSAPPYCEPFGCRVDARNFVAGVDRGQYAPPSRLVQNLRKLKSSLYMIAADEDEYVPIGDVKAFFETRNGAGELLTLSGVSHEIGRSVGAAMIAAKQVVAYGLRAIGRTDEPSIPSLVDVIAQSQKESEYINSVQ